MPRSPRQEAAQRIPEPLAAPSAPEAEAADEQAKRTAIVGELAGGILHDLNNVLTVITGTIEILAEAVDDRPQLAAVARLIDEAATRGARLATCLLAFASGRPSVRDEVDVNALLAEAASLLRPTLAGRIEVAFEPADNLPAALADSAQLLAAVLSFGIAIRDAMPDGGTLTLRAGLIDAAALGVVATGRADERAPALPIDLRFVESLVGRCGGALNASRSDVGTSIEIVLPAANAVQAKD